MLRCKINSTREYKQGEELELMKNGEKIMPVASETVSFDSAIAIILAGMALAVFHVASRNAGDRAGSVLLVLLLFAAGWILLSSFMKDRKRHLIEIEGKITDVLYYRRGENKKLIKASESYYPLIRYKLHDKEKTFISSYNSSLKTAYKTGRTVKLYYDEKTKSLAEKKASPLLALSAVILWCIAAVGIVSILG